MSKNGSTPKSEHFLYAKSSVFGQFLTSENRTSQLGTKILAFKGHKKLFYLKRSSLDFGRCLELGQKLNIRNPAALKC